MYLHQGSPVPVPPVTLQLHVVLRRMPQFSTGHRLEQLVSCTSPASSLSITNSHACALHVRGAQQLYSLHHLRQHYPPRTWQSRIYLPILEFTSPPSGSLP